MGKRMKQVFLTITLLFILSCAAFSDLSTIEKHKKEQIQRLKSVIIEDGINLEEAEVLSSEYFWRHISGCGMAGKPEDGGEFWLSIAYFGYAGVPLEEKIKVDKKTGAISMKDYPTIVNPLKEWNVNP